MAQNEMTLEEFVETLTGFEEIAISKQFEDDIYDLLSTRPTMGIRAAVMVEKIRAGATPPDARKSVLGLTVKTISDWFTDDDDDAETLDPDTMETVSGKDESFAE